MAISKSYDQNEFALFSLSKTPTWALFLLEPFFKNDTKSKIFSDCLESVDLIRTVSFSHSPLGGQFYYVHFQTLKLTSISTFKLSLLVGCANGGFEKLTVRGSPNNGVAIYSAFTN